MRVGLHRVFTKPSFLSLLCAWTLGCSHAEANPRAWGETPVANTSATARALEGCEVEERVGPCTLETVGAVESSNGEREVVAVYRVVDGDVVMHVERRYRASYLTAGEGPHMAFLRTHPLVSCRWQTVLRGVCPAYPATVEVPESTVREARRHRVQVRARAPRRARRRAT